MLNRVWMLAAVAAVCVVSGLAGAQEKGKGGVRTLNLSKPLPVEKIVPARVLSSLRETSRDIDVGGATAGVTDGASLAKALDDMGYPPQVVDQKYYIVDINGIKVVATHDPSSQMVFTYVFVPKIKDIENTPVNNILKAMENNSALAAWYFNSQDLTLIGIGGVEAKTASKVALRRRLEATANLWRNSAPHLEKVLDFGN